MEYPDSKKLADFKFVTATMFNRRQKHMWVDPSVPNNWYFSTMGYMIRLVKADKTSEVEVLTYEPRIIDFVHKVTVSDELVETLHHLIPQTKETTVCINVGDFNSVLASKGLDMVEETEPNKFTVLKVSPSGNETIKHLFTTLPKYFFDHICSFIEPIVKLKDTDRCLVMTKVEKPIPKKDIEIIDIPYKDHKTIKLPVYAGLTCLSSEDYIKKYKECVPMEIQMVEINRVLRPLYIHKDERIEILSVQPSFTSIPIPE